MNIAIDTKPLYRKGQLVEVQREDVIYHGVVIKVREVKRLWDQWIYIGQCVDYPYKQRYYQNNAHRYEWALFEDEITLVQFPSTPYTFI
ncbi:MAG: hypothetical protein PUP92_34595 [Rhizonema sp. PD38]|nr:hypothetical protein [Rhizonema sp. PD38]